MISRIELQRKLVHLVVGIVAVILLFYDIIGVRFLLILLALGIVGFFLFKAYRFYLIKRILQEFERKKNLKDYPGAAALLYIVGMVLALAIFPRDVALASILVLAVGDSVGAVVGRFGGFEFTKKKMWEGILAGIVASGFATLLFVSAWEGFIDASVGMLIEGLDLHFGGKKLDDNIFLPLIAGGTMMLVRVVMGLF